jgi:hypothetical protein
MLRNQGRLDTTKMHVWSYGQGIKLPMVHLDIKTTGGPCNCVVSINFVSHSSRDMI